MPSSLTVAFVAGVMAIAGFLVVYAHVPALGRRGTTAPLTLEDSAGLPRAPRATGLPERREEATPIPPYTCVGES